MNDYNLKIIPLESLVAVNSHFDGDEFDLAGLEIKSPDRVLDLIALDENGEKPMIRKPTAWYEITDKDHPAYHVVEAASLAASAICVGYHTSWPDDKENFKAMKYIGRLIVDLSNGRQTPDDEYELVGVEIAYPGECSFKIILIRRWTEVTVRGRQRYEQEHSIRGGLR